MSLGARLGAAVDAHDIVVGLLNTPPASATFVAPLLVLAGGFALRWIMVAAGQA